MPTIPGYAMRDLRFLVKEVIAFAAVGAKVTADLGRRAEKVLGFIAPRRRAAKTLLEECRDCDGCGWVEGGKTLKTTCTRCNGTGTVPQPTAKERKATKKAVQQLEDERIYRAVMARPGHRCELGAHEPPALYKIDLHHLIAGAAKRALQNVNNCLRACTRCHLEWHRSGAEAFRARVLGWCVLNDYPVPPIFRRAPR